MFFITYVEGNGKKFVRTDETWTMDEEGDAGIFARKS
jgi:hypothetical protein